MNPRNRCAWPARLLAGIAVALMGGCASVTIDGDGRRHVIGLVWLTLPPPSVESVGAETLRARSVGLSVSNGPLGASAVLGYSDQAVTTIRNDSAVRLPISPSGVRP